MSDLHFIEGKVLHKQQKYSEAQKSYFESLKMDPNNQASQFNLAKIHFLNGNFNAVDECLSRVLADAKYKDCFEAIKLLAKVKCLQDKRYEAFSLYKRILELNPMDFKSMFEVGQMFDQVD